MSAASRRQAFARWTATIIPLILLAILGFCTYVFIVQIAVVHLLRGEDPPTSRRPGFAVAIITVYFILLALFVLPYLRIIQTQVVDPGYVPKGQSPEPHVMDDTPEASDTHAGGRSVSPREKPCGRISREDRGWETRPTLQINPQNIVKGAEYPPPGLERFYRKDAFVCDYFGLPIWCHYCGIWKPDRCHHCSDSDRCTRKMDHYCPWVGGIVSEVNLKYFIQFLIWAAMFTIFITIVMGVLFAQSGTTKTTWVILVTISGTFTIFTVGMALNTLYITARNLTTVENLDHKAHVYFLAVLLRTDYDRPSLSNADGAHQSSGPEQLHGRPTDHPGSLDPYRGLRTITYPLPYRQPPTSSISPTPGAGSNERTSAPTGSHDPVRIQWPPGPKRVFAILQTPQGTNPWDLGSAVANLNTVLGCTWLDWLLPLRRSPCCDHAHDARFEFPFGPALARLKREAGIREDGSVVVGPATRDGGGHRPATRDRDRERRKRRRRRPSESDGRRSEGSSSGGRERRQRRGS